MGFDASGNVTVTASKAIAKVNTLDQFATALVSTIGPALVNRPMALAQWLSLARNDLKIYTMAAPTPVPTPTGPLVQAAVRGSGFRAGHQHRDYPLVGDDLPWCPATTPRDGHFLGVAGPLQRRNHAVRLREQTSMLSGRTAAFWINRDGNGTYARWDARRSYQIPQAPMA